MSEWGRGVLKGRAGGGGRLCLGEGDVRAPVSCRRPFVFKHFPSGSHDHSWGLVCLTQRGLLKEIQDIFACLFVSIYYKYRQTHTLTYIYTYTRKNRALPDVPGFSSLNSPEAKVDCKWEVTQCWWLTLSVLRYWWVHLCLLMNSELISLNAYAQYRTVLINSVM